MTEANPHVEEVRRNAANIPVPAALRAGLTAVMAIAVFLPMVSDKAGVFPGLGLAGRIMPCLA